MKKCEMFLSGNVKRKFAAGRGGEGGGRSGGGGVGVGG